MFSSGFIIRISEKVKTRWCLTKTILVVVLLFFSVQGSAQVFAPFFKTLNTEQGLSHNKINKVIEDRRGFIWIATEDGLNRYDGRYFKVFRASENGMTGIGGNIINDVYEDKDGVIWIGSADGGLTKYDYRLAPAFQFRNYRFKAGQKSGIPENNILRIVESNGVLWLATSKSYVVRFDKATERFDIPVKSGTRAILSLMTIAKDTLLVGRAGGGVLFINTKTGQSKQDFRYNNLYGNLPHASVPGMFRDNKARLWIASWDNKLYRYLGGDVFRGEVAEIISPPQAANDELTPYAQDTDSRIWMGSKNSGITVIDKAGLFLNYRYDPFKDGTVANDNVNHIFISSSGIVWISTDHGLSVYNPLFSAFQQHELPKQSRDVQVNDFHKEPGGDLWIASSEGLYIKKVGQNTFEHRSLSYKGHKLNITKFFIDRDGTWYLGTDYSLFTYHPASNTLSLLPNTTKDPVMRKLISSRIVSIVRDTIGNHPVLLVSPYGHYLTYYDLTDKKWISREDKKSDIINRFGLKDNLINRFFKSTSGEIWLANNNSGLGEWNPILGNQVRYFGNEAFQKGIGNIGKISDIIQNMQKGLWISSYGGGLNYFDLKSKKFTHIRESSNLTEGMKMDAQGKLWMIANGHIHLFEPSERICCCYALPGMKKSGGVKGYIYRDAINRLYAGGINNFIEFDPREVRRIPSEPKVFLTDFQIFNTSYAHYLQEKIIELEYKQNYFSIEFSAPDFSGDNVVYSYKLEGLDKKWTDAGKRNFATYANLPGGKYVFKVRATNWLNESAKHYTYIKIYINPPFWMKWWFYLLLALILIIIGTIGYSLRIREIVKRHSMRNGIAQDLHDNIGSTLSSILVYTEVAKRYHKSEWYEPLYDVLTSIESVSSEMISEMGDIVWAINPKNDNLQGIIDRIKAYGMPLCHAKNINFKISGDTKLFDLALDMKIRKNLYLIFKESLNNAIKYSICKNILLHVFLESGYVHFALTDDGIGFCHDGIKDINNDSLSGNGLKNLQQRAEELSAKLEIISGPEKGTTVFLKLPVSSSTLKTV